MSTNTSIIQIRARHSLICRCHFTCCSKHFKIKNKKQNTEQTCTSVCLLRTKSLIFF